MPTTVQFRRGTTAQNNAFTGANGEISVDTDDGRLVVHDASTAGGVRQALASETIFRVIADDSTGIFLQGGTDELRISGGNGISTSTDSGGSLTVSLDSTDSATFNGGVIIDNITIDGTEIDLSSGDLTVDVAGDIILDAGGDEIIFKDGSANVGHVSMDSDNLTIKSLVSDKDIIFQGNDGGAGITALTLDMGSAGAAAFNSTVTATGFIIGSADINETDLEKIDGITNGAGAANKALVLDGSANVASGLAALTASGVVTAAGFTIGSAVINEADLEKIDGITDGAGAANKAVVLDGDADVASGLRNLTASGTLTSAAVVTETISSADSTSVFFNDGITLSGPIKSDASAAINIDDALDVEGAITSGAITSSGVITGTGFTIGSAVINETDLEKIDGITNGAGAANKALVLDGSADVASGLAALTASGVITAAGFTIGSAAINEAELETIDGVTAGTVAASKAVVVDSDKDISSFRNLTATGTITTANIAATGNIQLDGNLTVSGTTVSVNTTNLEIQDALLELSKNNSGGADVDAGIFIQRGSAGNNAVFYWNEGDDKFKAVLSNSVATATAVTDSSTATIVATFEGDLTGTTVTCNEIVSSDSSFVNINDGLNVDGNIQTTSGNITAGGSFIIGSADMNETDLEKLDGITNGAGAANKALVLDADADVASGLRNVTASGSITAGSFVIGSADINETDLEQLDGLTAGTVAASKAVVADANKDITTFRNCTATTFIGALTGNADTATTLATTRAIGGVNFNGSAAIDLPGVNSAGNQNTSGTAAIATAVTVVANNTANESVFITFVDGATGTQGIETDTNLTYNPSTNVIASTASAAQYADLAELYSADEIIEPGTVVSFGGDAEITQSTQSHDPKVAGVVSTAPAYLMNSKLENGTALTLHGRVPCKVVGTINKGDLIVSSEMAGVGRSMDSSAYTPGCVIGKALEAYDSDTVGSIEVVVGRL